MLNKNNYKPQLNKLPEKVLQFGTGVLLRGLCDYFIDKANKKGVFNGSIVVVKSTGPNVSEFTSQDNLYTLCIRGIEDGQILEKNIVVESISRVLSTTDNWFEILKTAENEELKIVISNTTEVGLQYIEEKITDACPESFPAKLTAWLLRRYNTNQAEVVVIPTELLVDNGKILKDLVIRQIEANALGNELLEWVQAKVKFCSSLVDRIVPGKPTGDDLAKIETSLGYKDNLLIKAEAYRLWAIEGENLDEVLSFAETDSGVKLEKNIEKFRELKLRLLNAPHTLMSGMAFLSGFNYVKDLLNDETMEKYLSILMLTELGPSISLNFERKITERYGNEVMDRFRNPFLDHHWLSITLQYTMKMKMRAIPLLLNYYKVFNTVPHYFTRCFAAYLLFMKVTELENGKYFGTYNNQKYPINCDSADYFMDVWQNKDLKLMVETVLSNAKLWGGDLTTLPGFAENVEIHLANMMHVGVKEVASTLNVFA